MKKKNWIGTAAATIASALLLTLWYVLGFNYVDAPLDLIISIIWWVVLAASVAGIAYAEQKRRRAMRTLFIGESMMFNPERGLVEIGEADVLDEAAMLLDDLEYGFATEEMTGHVRPLVEAIVYTDKFNLEDGVWEGEVRFTETPDAEPVAFEDRAQLEYLLRIGAAIPTGAPPVIPAYPAAAMA